MLRAIDHGSVDLANAMTNSTLLQTYEAPHASLGCLRDLASILQSFGHDVQSIGMTSIYTAVALYILFQAIKIQDNRHRLNSCCPETVDHHASLLIPLCFLLITSPPDHLCQ